jgi:hypothetical protein
MSPTTKSIPLPDRSTLRWALQHPDALRDAIAALNALKNLEIVTRQSGKSSRVPLTLTGENSTLTLDLSSSGGSSSSGVATALKTTSGPTVLPIGAIADGQILKRVGTVVRGVDPSPTPSFTFSQPEPSSLWIINHNLGAIVATTIFDTGGNEIEAEISNPTANQTRVAFSTATAGKARCQ